MCLLWRAFFLQLCLVLIAPTRVGIGSRCIFRSLGHRRPGQLSLAIPCRDGPAELTRRRRDFHRQRGPLRGSLSPLQCFERAMRVQRKLNPIMLVYDWRPPDVYLFSLRLSLVFMFTVRVDWLNKMIMMNKPKIHALAYHYSLQKSKHHLRVFIFLSVRMLQLSRLMVSVKVQFFSAAERQQRY